MELADIRQAIMWDVANRDFTNKGIAPLFQAPSTAKILIIGQAPGLKTQEKGSLGICRLARILHPNGTHLFWTNCQSLS